MTDHVAAGFHKDHGAILEARAEQAELARKLAQNLKPIAKQKKLLASLRKGLTKLSTEPSNSERLNLAKSIAKILFAEINKPAAGAP